MGARLDGCDVGGALNVLGFDHLARDDGFLSGVIGGRASEDSCSVERCLSDSSHSADSSSSKRS